MQPTGNVTPDLLVVGGTAFPLAGVVHTGCADGTADELSGAGGHELIHRRGDVHSLVCHEIICNKKKTHTPINQSDNWSTKVGKNRGIIKIAFMTHHKDSLELTILHISEN